MVVHPNEEALSAWMDGEAAPDEAQELRVHLGGCALCRARLEELADVGAVLAPLRAVTPPATLREHLMEEWESRWGRLKSRRPVGSFALAWMPALAAGMVAALVAPQFLPKSEPPTVPLTTPAPPSIKDDGREKQEVALLPGLDIFKKRPDSLPPVVPAPRPKSPQTSSNTDASKARFSQVKSDGPRRRAVTGRHRWKGTVSSSSGNIQSEDHNETNDPEPPKVQPNSEIALAAAPPDDPDAQAASNMVFELTVEDDPNAAPVHLRKSLCAWTTETGEDGEVNQGAIAHNYDEQGNLKSVVVNLALNEPTSDFPTSTERSTATDSAPTATTSDLTTPSPAEPAEIVPAPSDPAPFTPSDTEADPPKTDSSDTPQPSASSQKDKPNETLDPSSGSTHDLFAGDTESHRTSGPLT